MHLLLRSARHREGGPWSPEDWDVISEDGAAIGRVYCAHHGTSDRWIWSIYGHGPAQLAPSLEEAKTALKAKWEKLSGSV